MFITLSAAGRILKYVTHGGFIPIRQDLIGLYLRDFTTNGDELTDNLRDVIRTGKPCNVKFTAVHGSRRETHIARVLSAHRPDRAIAIIYATKKLKVDRPHDTFV